MILAGDIGGTKTVLGLFEALDSSLTLTREARFASRDFDSLESIIRRFLSTMPNVRIDAACFGVAGAVLDGKAKTTNLPWQLDETRLARAIGATNVRLINDLAAAAIGMAHLGDKNLAVIQAGTEPNRKGNACVLAAGTGLGEAVLYWDGKRHHAVASEGGHADFAPRNEIEIDLLRYLTVKFAGHVSKERLVSGPGLFNIYQFLRDTKRSDEPPELAEALIADDPNAIISQFGLEGTHEICVKTLDLFCSIYGASAGNVALSCVASGGVYLGGGIAPKILPALKKGSFITAFRDKGRFADLLSTFRVVVALEPKAPLLGAAHYINELFKP